MFNIRPFDPILINRSCLPDSPCLSQVGTGRAEVLQKVVPKLCLANSAKTAQYLQQVDDYMRLETDQLLQRLAPCCSQVSLAEGEFELALSQQKIVIKNSAQALQELTELANTDPWCIGAFAWLQANYLGLVHSHELRQFAALYQHNRAEAVATYSHFEQTSKGLQCKLIYFSGTLTMCWESPLQRFYVRRAKY